MCPVYFKLRTGGDGGRLDVEVSRRYCVYMARTIIDIDPDMLVRAQRALRTGTKRDTVNAALELAAAVDAERRATVLESFRDLLDRMDTDIIDRDEAEDHGRQVA